MDKQLLRDFCHHQTCSIKAPERNSKHGKEQVPVTVKANQLANTKNEMKMNQLLGKKTSQLQNGRINVTHNNINIECKWTKHTNQKTHTGKLDKKSEPIGVLYSGNPSHIQRHT